MSVGAVKIKNSAKSPFGEKAQISNSTIASSVAVGLGQYLKTLGLDGTSVLRTAGLKQYIFNDRYSRIPLQQLETALEISELKTNDPLLGLHFGEWYWPPVLYAFHYAINCAPDLRMALTTMQDHRNLAAGMPTQLTIQSAYTELSWSIGLQSESSRHVTDFITMRTLDHIQKAVGEEWKPLRVNLAYEKPDDASEYFRLLGSNIHFDQPKNGFWIDSATMTETMPEANRDMFHIALNSFRNPFPREQDDNNPVDRLRRFVSNRLDKSSVTLANASKYMDMTPQQLHRALKKHDTSFQCVLNETRKAHAIYYLTETETRFSEIAFLLGFSDQSSFTRSVKRWFGATPKEVRHSYR